MRNIANLRGLSVLLSLTFLLVAHAPASYADVEPSRVVPVSCTVVDHDGEECIAATVSLRNVFGIRKGDVLKAELYKEDWSGGYENVHRNGVPTEPLYCDSERRVIGLGDDMTISPERESYTVYVPLKVINHYDNVHYRMAFFTERLGFIGNYDFLLFWHFDYYSRRDIGRTSGHPLLGFLETCRYRLYYKTVCGVSLRMVLPALLAFLMLAILLWGVYRIDDSVILSGWFAFLMRASLVFCIINALYWWKEYDIDEGGLYDIIVFVIEAFLLVLLLEGRKKRVDCLEDHGVPPERYEEYRMAQRRRNKEDKKEAKRQKAEEKRKRMQQDEPERKTGMTGTGTASGTQTSSSSGASDSDNGWVIPAVIFGIIGILAIYWDAGGDFGRSKRQRSSSYNYNYDYDYNIGAGSFGQDPAGYNTVGFNANKRVDGAENTSDGYIPSGQITLYRRSNGDASVFDLYIKSTNRYVKVGKNAFKKIENGEVKVNGVTYCTKP